ncbi:MAG: Vitamin B12 dependent methionine synthase activation subunit [Clostridia bacterium]|nr:Vitamin B12 dependent methionine synthase activation subunit [Clostridia bacterium]
MNCPILLRTYKEPPFCEKEILRYAGCRDDSGGVSELLAECMDEVRKQLVYKVCYRELTVTARDGICDFDSFSLESEKLCTNLAGCDKVILFAATVGVGIDRLIARYGRISPSKALMLQAIGAERIEALCDSFCNDLAREYETTIRPRFSPGYGDLPLDCQKQIFALLDCERRIGLTLGDSLLMSPTKSVTAFAGLGGKEKNNNKCGGCNSPDSSIRGNL